LTLRSGTSTFLEKEKLLLRRVRFGELAESRHLLRELFMEIQLDEALFPGILRPRLLELILVVSRGAVRGGASVLQVQEIKSRVVAEINSAVIPVEMLAASERAVVSLAESVKLTGRVNPATHTVLQAAFYLRRNYHRPLRLEEVAREVRISPFYLARIFKLDMGCTIREYLTRLRIERAKDLLQDPSLHVNEVARRVGFSDSGYFTKVFKQAEGITPTEFQRRYG
ncbi:MAG: helix-turn-helix transcriptional regulator, partial [Firmicutes bacterium]|nr:helix-turn-helix transcriptional regulator [Bacillota bacterium]